MLELTKCVVNIAVAVFAVFGTHAAIKWRHAAKKMIDLTETAEKELARDPIVVPCEKCLYRSQYADENGLYKCGGILNENGDAFMMVSPNYFCGFGKKRGGKAHGDQTDIV